MRQYAVSVVEGRQYVNGRLAQSVIDVDRGTVSISNPSSVGTLAKRAFAAGQIAQDAERRDPTDDELEILDDTVVIFRAR